MPDGILNDDNWMNEGETIALDASAQPSPPPVFGGDDTASDPDASVLQTGSWCVTDDSWSGDDVVSVQGLYNSLYVVHDRYGVGDASWWVHVAMTASDELSVSYEHVPGSGSGTQCDMRIAYLIPNLPAGSYVVVAEGTPSDEVEVTGEGSQEGSGAGEAEE